MKGPPQRVRDMANVSHQRVTYSNGSIAGLWMLLQSHSSLILAEDGVEQFFKLKLILSMESPDLSSQILPPSTHITPSQIRMVLGFPSFTCSQPWLHIRKIQRVLFVCLVGWFHLSTNAQ